MNRSASRLLAAGGMLALAAALGIGRFVYTPILPAMQQALGLSTAEAGLIASANYLGYLLGALAAAATSLLRNRRSWLLGALALSAGSTAGMAAGDTLAQFIALRFIGGIASAFVIIFASALVLERLAAAGRSALSAVHFAGVGLGILLSAVTVSVLSAAGASWRALWSMTGVIALAAAVGVVGVVPNTDAPYGAAHEPKPVRSSAPLAFLVVAYGFFGLGYVITSTFLVTMVRATPRSSTSEPFVWAVFGLAAIPSVALWTWLARRLGTPRTFATACVVEAIGVAASVLWPTVTGTYLAALLLGGTFMGLTALGLIGARQLSAANPRRAIALMTASFGVGQMLGPVVAGLMHDRLGDFRAATMLAVAALVVAAGLSSR